MAEHVVYSASDLDDAGWDYLEQCVTRFEQSWRTGNPPTVDNYLPPCEHALRRAILVELVKVDLEYRWESGQGPPVETYVERWPELTTNQLPAKRLGSGPKSPSINLADHVGHRV